MNFLRFQSQTGSQALSDAEAAIAHPEETIVSIPNGKSGPLRHQWLRGLVGQVVVSIPNGKSGPLRQRMIFYLHREARSFNPKREVRPSQTPPLTIAPVTPL